MLTLCVAGDIILMAPIPAEYDAESESLRQFIRSADLRAANMESTISNYDQFASTFCGGSWLTVPDYILKELDMFDFQYYSFANNHTWTTLTAACCPPWRRWRSTVCYTAV